MKKFSILIIFCLFSFICRADEKPSVILDLQETPVAAEIEDLSAEERINRLIEEAQHFDRQYPGNALNTDFSEDVAARFPGLSRQEVYDYESYIRQGLSAYRFFKDLYQKYTDALLVPPNPPLVLDDREYDLLSPQTDYVNADGTVIIQDFKKVISYSSDPKDTRSYIAKLAYDSKHGKSHSAFDEFYYIADSIDWRHIFYYDIYYHSPLTGNRGIGTWEGDKETVRARVITVETGTEDKTELTGAIHIFTAPGYYITATGNGNGMAPQINFEKTQNLKNIKYTLPLPARLLGKDTWEDRAIYSGEIAIPFTAELETPGAPIRLEAQLDLNLCDKTRQCRKISLSSILELQGEYSRTSSVAAFIRQIHYTKPAPQLAELPIRYLAVEEVAGQGEILKIIFDSNENISFFDMFVDFADGIATQRPRITIDGREITVRILPVNPSQKIAGRSFEIMANLNGKYFLRTTKTAALNPNAAPRRRELSWTLLGLAFLGGFILNFMPCVFPVLSLKLFSLTRFGARRQPEVRRNFAYTLLGIFCSFFVLASFLALLKFIGTGIGWGMQFQSPVFLVLMIMAVILFILQISGLAEVRLPRFVQEIDNRSRPDSFLHFFTGILVVLMATPCTAPYLGTAVGFALSGSIADIFAVMAAIGAGLALPYILLFAFPALIILVPTPGPWMQKLNRFMLLMLAATLVWLMTVLLAQTNMWFIIRMLFYGLLFALFCWLMQVNREMVDEAETADRSPHLVRRIANTLLALAMTVTAIAAVDGKIAGDRHMEEVRRKTVPSLQQQEISRLLAEGKTVLVSVGADWCLTCHYNNAAVFKNPAFTRNLADKQVEVIHVDWTNYDSETLRFMEKYGRSGLPFYIIFSPLIPEGMVLSEILNEPELTRLINNITTYQPRP